MLKIPPNFYNKILSQSTLRVLESALGLYKFAGWLPLAKCPVVRCDQNYCMCCIWSLHGRVLQWNNGREIYFYNTPLW